MSHPLRLPLEPYVTGDFRRFGERLRRRIILWATHLGDDLVATAGTSVHAIGDGVVVWREMRLGSAEKKEWGGSGDRAARPGNQESGIRNQARVAYYSPLTTNYSLLFCLRSYERPER